MDLRAKEWWLGWWFVRLFLCLMLHVAKPISFVFDKHDEIHYLDEEAFAPQHGWEAIVYTYEEMVDKGLVVPAKARRR